MQDLESVAFTREGYMQEEIVRALAQERELWQRERESLAIAMEREKSQHIAEASLLQGYIGILINKMKGQGMSVPLAPYIPGRDPPIWRHETEHMLVPPGLVGGW